MFSGTATNAGTAVNIGVGATGYSLVLSGDLTAANVTVGGTLTYDDVTNIDSVGLITARNGLQVLAGISTLNGQTNLANVNVSAAASFSGNISIADSIFHTGDTDTAIRFPSNNVLTVETAGGEAIRVDAGRRLLVEQIVLLIMEVSLVSSKLTALRMPLWHLNVVAIITLNPYLFLQNQEEHQIHLP